MNLLFFYRIYPCYGGVEVVTTVLSNKFVKDGHKVTIVSIEQPNPELLNQLDSSIEVIKLEYPVINKVNINRLHNIIINKNIDLVINQWGLPYKSTILCNKAIKGTNCKLISVLHGSPYTSKVIIKAQDKVKRAHSIIDKCCYQVILKIKEEIIKWSIRYNIKHNEKFILLSNSFIQPLIKYSRVKNATNIISIGNPITIPVDLTDFSIHKKKKQILYAGRMDFENKRVNRIIDAWKMICNDYLDWELILVGNGPYKDELISIVSNEKIRNVHFEDFQVEPPVKFYKDASIYMLTSDLEGFGLVIVESMSYGVVPIVYGSYEAVYDIIEQGKSGFITSMPYNNNNTVNLLRKLIENESLRNEMAANAIKRAKLFDLESIVNKWYLLFQEVLDNPIMSKRNNKYLI